MRQFDICRLQPVQGARKRTDLAVILQAYLNSDLETRIVAPLVAEDALPALEFDGRVHCLNPDRLSVLNLKSIGACVGSCADGEWDIRQSLDIVFMGV